MKIDDMTNLQQIINIINNPKMYRIKKVWKTKLMVQLLIIFSLLSRFS